MADPIDEANKLAYKATRAAIKAQKEKAKAEKMEPKGSCYNCDKEFKKSKDKELIFCDTDCRDDYEWFQSRNKVNKRV